jgi:hypothetical protein
LIKAQLGKLGGVYTIGNLKNNKIFSLMKEINCLVKALLMK